MFRSIASFIHNVHAQHTALPFVRQGSGLRQLGNELREIPVFVRKSISTELSSVALAISRVAREDATRDVNRAISQGHLRDAVTGLEDGYAYVRRRPGAAAITLPQHVLARTPNLGSLNPGASRFTKVLFDFVDVKGQRTDLNAPDPKGMRPVEIAVRARNPDFLRELAAHAELNPNLRLDLSIAGTQRSVFDLARELESTPEVTEALNRIARVVPSTPRAL